MSPSPTPGTTLVPRLIKSLLGVSLALTVIGASGGGRGRKLISGRWRDHSWLRGPGDFDHDGRPDLISLVGDQLLLHRGIKGGFAAPVKLATGWRSVTSITSVGDFTGDHYVIARTTGEKLVLYKGDGHATLTGNTTLPGSFTGTRSPSNHRLVRRWLTYGSTTF